MRSDAGVRASTQGAFTIASYAGVGKTQSQQEPSAVTPTGDPVPPLTHLFEFSDASVA